MEDSVGYGKPPVGTQFQIGNDAGQGRKKGSKNRSTSARRVLDMLAKVPAAQMAKLKALFPELLGDLSTEDLMSLAMAARAITKGDFNAYRVLMDSAYGSPKQTIDSSMDIVWHETKSYAPDQGADQDADSDVNAPDQEADQGD